MHLLDWHFLDALQAGALASLFLGFAVDALSRRDRLMGWMALTCLLIGLRHFVMALGTHSDLNPDLVDRAQNLLVTSGFLALCMAMVELFPGQVPKLFPAWMALGLVPTLARSLFVSNPGLADTWLRNASNLGYLIGCSLIIHWALRAKEQGDPMGRRLFFGFLWVALPVAVEISAMSFFDMKIRLSGFSLTFLAMAVGTSWQWHVVNLKESRIIQAEAEATAWKSLVPGLPFHSERPSPEMEHLFGHAWARKVKSRHEGPWIAADGTPYRLYSLALNRHERVGWVARIEQGERLPSGHPGFLSGWTMALGIDSIDENRRLKALLRYWGAEVVVWGMVPPREGPFPSILLWAREPSILSVWREGDLLRRRPRWVQIGGPITEGPHARLESDPSEYQLHGILEELLSRR